LRFFSVAFYKDVMDNQYIAKKLIENKKTMSKKIFMDIIEEGIGKGEVRKLDVEFVAEFLNIMIDGMLTNYSELITSEVELKDFCSNFYDFLKYGLLGN
jgi:hypothetical protein